MVLCQLPRCFQRNVTVGYCLVLRRHSSNKVKLSYFHNPGSEPLRQITIGGLLDKGAETWPDRPAVISIHQDRVITFQQANEKANNLAAGFLELGLKPGDRLGLLGVNSIEWYITMMAAAKAGLILVNINPAFLTEELKYCLKKVDTKALVTDENFRSHSHYSNICSIIPELSTKESGKSFDNDILPSLQYLIVNTENHLPGAFRLKDVMNKAKNLKDLEEVEMMIQPDHPCNIQFSSGTTGLPKAAVLTHFTINNNSYFFGKRLGFNKKHHKLCLQVPMFHTFGATLGILSSLNHGVTLVLPSQTFKASSTAEALRKVGCSIIYGTPTMYVDLCSLLQEQMKTDPSLKRALQGFDIIVSGGAVCTPSLFKNIAQTFNCTNVASAYGMTETSPIMMQNTEKDTYEQKVTTVGFVAEHAEVKVVDKEGRLVPMGTPGEVWFRSYATMLGYWEDKEKTKEAITACRWIKSGDLFILHENGYGQVVGRIKDVIIRGGENIFPAEVEEFLEKHPNVLEAQVYGVSDPRLGEDVCASIKLHPNKNLTAEELKEFCKGKIAHFKIPKYIKFVDEFPKTASGKVKKFMMREEMEKERKANKP